MSSHKLVVRFKFVNLEFRFGENREKLQQRGPCLATIGSGPRVERFTPGVFQAPMVFRKCPLQPGRGSCKVLIQRSLFHRRLREISMCAAALQPAKAVPVSTGGGQ